MVVHLLHRIGRQYDHVEIAVAAAFAGLEIVALRRLDRTQSRAAALAVDHQAGQFRPRQVACLLYTSGPSTTEGSPKRKARPRNRRQQVRSRLPEHNRLLGFRSGRRGVFNEKGGGFVKPPFPVARCVILTLRFSDQPLKPVRSGSIKKS